jgi:hypothetical protein
MLAMPRSTNLPAYREAGKHQIPNNIQIPISNEPNGVVSDFGHLVIGKLFGIWNLTGG